MENKRKSIPYNIQHFAGGAKNGITTEADLDVKAREVDFVSRFTQTWDALRKILSITKPIKKQTGTQLVSYKAQMKSEALQGGATVGEGEEIPYTEFEIVPASYSDIKLEKYAKAVSIEAVAKYGAEVAIEKTDKAFLNQLQGGVMNRFYNFLATGTLTGTYTTWKMALAMAKGLVLDKFNKMQLSVTEVVAFVNVLDVYEYIGAENVTVQTQFGLQYIKDFMGYGTVFLLSAPLVPRGKVFATPVENIDLYYIDPSDSDFKKLGLDYTVQGETNLIGFHANGDYTHAVGESFALLGMELWAEYIDGIAVVTVNAGV